MSKYIKKGKLPRLATVIVPSKELAIKLYEEEPFDCIRANIETNYTVAQYVNPKGALELIRKPKKERSRKIQERLLQRFTVEQLRSFDSKKKRRDMIKSFSNQREYSIFCALCKEMLRKIKTKRRVKEKKKKKFSQYDTYMKSQAWTHRRNEYWKLHPKRCAVCNSAQYIHLHHMDYSMLEKEPDDHLVALCRSHHDQYHAENGVQKHMTQKTQHFIEVNRAALESTR